MNDLKKFIELRDSLLKVKDYNEALKIFKWPHITKFNWAIDYFDKIATSDKTAIIYYDTKDNERKISFNDLRIKSNKVANFLTDLGLQKGDRVMMMMETSIEIFEVMLGILKVGGVVIPASSLLTPNDVSDRIERGKVKLIITHKQYVEKFNKAGVKNKNLLALVYVDDIFEKNDVEINNDWINYSEAYKFHNEYTPAGLTFTSDPMFMFFTSGTTASPKLVIHTYQYPIGHLTTMYWIGVQPGDIHYNISSPGWAKYAWSSFFAPFNAEATILVLRYSQFDPDFALKSIEKYKVTTLCAPLSVWKLFVQKKLAEYKFNLREIVSAGEPLNPEIIKQVKTQLGITIREGFGQTETTAMIGYFKGMQLKEGSLGKVSPGYNISLLDDNLDEVKNGKDGQISVEIYPIKPLGLLMGYDDEERNQEIFKGGWYFTGDIAYKDEDGYFYFVGRNDDVFKSLDYRISPFELESELMKHHAVMESAVVPVIDDRGRVVPKAFIVLKTGYYPNKETALKLFTFIRNNMALYKRPRYIEFLNAFPKTISSKVMRKDLRTYTENLRKDNKLGEYEYKESDFAEELNIRQRR